MRASVEGRGSTLDRSLSGSSSRETKSKRGCSSRDAVDGKGGTRLLEKKLHSLKKLPSFCPFFYENLMNSTFNDLLRKTLTNKVPLKKLQYEKAAIGIN